MFDFIFTFLLLVVYALLGVFVIAIVVAWGLIAIYSPPEVGVVVALAPCALMVLAAIIAVRRQKRG